jgi:hypothetical protein
MGSRTTATLLAALLALSTPGCGLLMFSTHQAVEINTDEGALLTIDGKKHDKPAPTTISVHRGKEHRVEAVLGDLRGGTTLAQRLMIPVVLMDFCTLGIGLLVDYISGTLYEFEPSVRINLGKAPPPTVSTPTTSTTPPPTVEADPCSMCGEPRGDETPCPHCGFGG